MNGPIVSSSSQQKTALLKRVSSASNIMNQYNNNNDDDDDMVQKSSILSYRQDNSDVKGSGAIVGKIQQRLQEEDIADMDITSLQQHLSTLREAIAELYLGIKQKTRDESDIPSPEEDREEREIIMSLDSYVIIEYIKSSVDIILNLKFEEIEKRLLDKNSLPTNDANNISEGGEEQRSPQLNQVSQHSNSQQDSMRNSTGGDGPPQVYEEIIQKLEGEVRKHIRIQQQLKLHIDSMENRIEELENENEKIDSEKIKIKKTNDLKSKEVDSRVREVEELLKAKDDVIKMHEMQFKHIKESEVRLRKEVEKLRAQASSISEIKNSSSHVDHHQEGQSIILNKTQPMIIKQNAAIKDGRKMSVKQNNSNLPENSLVHPQFGSYSSNNSFAMMVDGISPDRGHSTPDISGNPYLHQTQIVQKRKSLGAGTSSKNKKFAPNSVVDSLGLQPQFNAVASTYSTASSGKIIGQRKLSSQHGRTTKGFNGTTAAMKATQNAWLNNTSQVPVVQGMFPTAVQSQQQQQPPQFSNIINNNIQGLSINYSNQIIQPQQADPIQQFANNFLGVQQTNGIQDEDSESSNMNSHRRCKSQNIKRGSIERKKVLKQGCQFPPQQQQQQYGASHISQDVLLVQQITDALQKGEGSTKLRQLKNSKVPHSNQNGQISNLEETTSFDNIIKPKQQTQSFILSNNEASNRMLGDFGGVQHNCQSLTSNKVIRSGGTNRAIIQQHNQAVDEFAKNRFNQSYGGGVVLAISGKQKGISNNSKNAMNTSTTNQSIERSSNGGGGNISSSNTRTRNKKQHLNHNLTMAHYNQAMKNTGFDGSSCNFIDLNNFKSTQSVSQGLVNNNQTQVISGGNFSIPKQNNSATNTAAAMLNQNNIQMLKQQILAHKKASNLLMKGISPLKKT